MQRVVDLKTEPVIGQRYWVPCVEYWRENRGIGVGELVRVPVFGGLHEDRKYFAFWPYHWHIDWRFMSIRRIRKLRNGTGMPLSYLADGLCLSLPISIEAMGVAKQEPKEEAFRCARRMPELSENAAKMLRRLFARHYAESQVVITNGCRFCPHRGLPLDGLPVDREGVVTCPGHGLRWGKDGRMVAG